MGSLETAVLTLEQLSNNNPAQNSGIDILRAGLSEPGFGVGVIPELDLDFETIRIDEARRLAALVGTTALIAGVGAGTSVSEAAPQYGSNSLNVCPNPYIDYQFYKKDFPSRPASAGSDLVVASNDRYAIPSPTVLNNYACVGQESKAEFGIENVGPESAQGSTITVSMGSPDAGIHIDRLINPDTKEPLANCQIDPNSQSLTCNLGDLAMYGMAYAEAQYHADPLVGSQGPKASSIVASVQSSATENYPADNQITHPFNIYDQMAGAIIGQTLEGFQPNVPAPRIIKYAGPPKRTGCRDEYFTFYFKPKMGIEHPHIKIVYTALTKVIKIRKVHAYSLKRLPRPSSQIPFGVKATHCNNEQNARFAITLTADNLRKKGGKREADWSFRFDSRRKDWIAIASTKSSTRPKSTRR